MARTLRFFLGAVGALTMSSDCLSQPLIRTLSPRDLATDGQIGSLNREVAESLSGCHDVVLRFEPGIYRNVHLFIDDRGRPQDCAATLSIDRSGTEGSAVFEGGQKPKFVDIVTHRQSFPGTIRNLTVRDYMNGIVVSRTNSKKGEPFTMATHSRATADRSPGLTVRDNLFENLGDWEQNRGTSATGWGAVVFNFVHDNRAIRNRFQGLGNTIDSPLMHALYLSGSSGNVISNNYFGAMDGAAIKLRNRSNNNRIRNNVFRYGGEPLIQLWFCNQSLRGSRNCPTNECPSGGTIFSDNRIIHSDAKDRTRRGGGPIPVTNPFASYEKLQGLRLVERYYMTGGIPKSCSTQRAAHVIHDGAGNLVHRTP